MNAREIKLKTIYDRYNEINELLSSEEVASDPKKVAKLSKEEASLKEAYDIYLKYTAPFPGGCRYKLR